jgi:hypothetical protein
MVYEYMKMYITVLIKEHIFIGHHGWKLELPDNFCCKSLVRNF